MDRTDILFQMEVPGTKFSDGRQKTVRELIAVAAGPAGTPPGRRRVTWRKVQGPGPDQGEMAWSAWRTWCRSIWRESRPAVLPVPTVTDMELVFATGRYTPPWRWVPNEFRDQPEGERENAFNPWVRLIHDTYSGARLWADWQALPKKGVNADMAFNAMVETLCSHGIKHEQKLATCGWMLSEWFEDFWFKGARSTVIGRIPIPALPPLPPRE